jgi:hypothetical protein
MKRPLPLNMTYQDRMERLYGFLVQMGHVVNPVYKKDTEDQIDYLHVQVALSSEYPPGVASEYKKVVSLVDVNKPKSNDPGAA